MTSATNPTSFNFATPPEDGFWARAAVPIFTAGIILECFSGRWSEIGVPFPLDRALIVLGALLAVRSASRSGLWIRPRPLHLWMVAAVLVLALSVATIGTFTATSLFAAADRYGLVLFGLYLIAPLVYRRTEDLRFLAQCFSSLGLYLGFVAICQSAGLDSLVWPKYILDPNVGIHADRARGPYVEAVANGLMLVYSCGFSVIVLLTDYSRRWRIFAIVSIVLAVAGTLLTVTRAIWLAAAVGFATLVFTSRNVRRWSLVAAPVVFGVIGLMYVLIPGLSGQAESRSADQYPVWDRLNTNAAGVRMIESHPIFGIGWQRAAPEMAEFVRQGDSYPVTASSGLIEIHNVFLARGAELGLIGALPWLVVFCIAIVFPALRRTDANHVWSAWRAGLLLVLGSWLVAAMLGPLPYPQPNYVLWLMAGLVSSLAINRVPGDEEGERSVERWSNRIGYHSGSQ